MEAKEEMQKSASDRGEGTSLPKLYLLDTMNTNIASEGTKLIESEDQIPDDERHAVLVYIRNLSRGHGTEVNRICKQPIHLIQVHLVSVPRDGDGGSKKGSERGNQISFFSHYVTLE